jgi:hypothetical protein
MSPCPLGSATQACDHVRLDVDRDDTTLRPD